MVLSMKIDMKPILSGETNSIAIDYEFVLAREYKSDDIEIVKPVKVDGAVSAYAGYMELKLHAVIDYSAECARCLEPVKDVLEIDFIRSVAAEGTLQNEDNDDYIIIQDGVMDIAEPLIEQISMELPSRQLCGEDCKGLCPKCGVNLNETTCGCVTKEIDPRLAVLQQYLDKNDKN